LPTEAEWEYACRAESVTSWYYGESEELIGKYAWYAQNSGDRGWPVGKKKPNDFGLFEMHGNVWNWCQDRYKDHPRGAGDRVFNDNEDGLEINPEEGRILRAGSFRNVARSARSSNRNFFVPTLRFNLVGFRVARTMPVR
jgi:formylglycine-generating enzyme required for sulfatase activity